MKIKHIRILVLYLIIVFTMGFAYFVVQDRYSYERTHGSSPAQAPIHNEQ